MKSNVNSSGNQTGMGAKLLIPVDFSDMSFIAVKFGFEIASRLSLQPVLLHASPLPVDPFLTPYPFDYGGMENEAEEVEEMEIGLVMKQDADKKMHLWKLKIEKWQNEGKIDPLEFSTITAQGMPEEVICEYCRADNPHVVIMATRAIKKKERDLVGSVTAEVLDNCRTPLFAIPEDYEFCSVKDITRLVALCSLEGHDVACVDSLMQMFGNPAVEIGLVPLLEKHSSSRVEKDIESVREALQSKYPDSVFYSVALDGQNKREQLEEYMKRHEIQLILVPNKKKNIFARLFNPGIAHKILFEKDIPILALPV